MLKVRHRPPSSQKHFEYLEEVLYQCPGEQIAELGDAIATYAENLDAEVDVDDLRKHLRAWATDADAIEPLVEVLHEIGDDVDLQKETRATAVRPLPFQRDIELRYVQRTIRRLHAARASDDTDEARCCVHRLQNYDQYGCTPLIRELAHSEMRRDEANYGETPNEFVQIRPRSREH